MQNSTYKIDLLKSPVLEPVLLLWEMSIKKIIGYAMTGWHPWNARLYLERNSGGGMDGGRGDGKKGGEL